MRTFVLGVLLVSGVAGAAEAPGRKRLFIGTNADVGAGLTARSDLAVSTGGLGITVDVGRQVSNGFAVYASTRFATRLASHTLLSMLMVELSPTEHVSIASGVGGLAVLWLSNGSGDRGFVGLAVPVRLSWDLTVVKPIGLRVSLEAGVGPAGVRLGPGTCARCGDSAPIVWGALLVGTAWR